MTGEAAIVEARVSDPFTVGRNARIIIRPFAVCESLDRKCLDINRVDFRIAVQILSVGLADAGYVDSLAVGGPLRIAMVVVPLRDLAAGPSQSRIDDEYMVVLFDSRPESVAAPTQTVD